MDCNRNLRKLKVCPVLLPCTSGLLIGTHIIIDANRGVSQNSYNRVVSHYETRLFKYIENFTTKTKENFQIKNSDICHIFAQT